MLICGVGTFSVAAALEVRVGVGVGIHAHGPADVGDDIIDTGAVTRRAGIELEVFPIVLRRHIGGPHP